MWVIRDLVITLALLSGLLVALVVLPIIATGIIILIVGIITYAGVHDARIKAKAQEEIENSDSENNNL